MNRRYIVSDIARIIIALLFIFSGVVKSVDPMGTAIKLTEYMAVFSLDYFLWLATPIAVLLCALETLLGLMLLLGIYRKVVGYCAAIFLLFFTLLTLYIAIYNPVEDCGCFGDALKISNEATFIKNIIFLSLSLVMVRFSRARKSRRGDLALGVLSLVLSLWLPIYSVVWLPPIDFMPYNVGVNIAHELNKEQESSEYKTTLIYKSLEDGRVEEFEVDDPSWQDDQKWEYVDTKSTLIKKGKERSITSFDIYDGSGENQFYRLVPQRGRAIALVISSNTLSKSEAEKVRGLYHAAQECGAEIFALSAMASDEVTIMLSMISDTHIECYSMDETLLKSFLRAKNGYVVFDNGTISAKQNLKSSPLISDCEQLDRLAKRRNLFVRLFINETKAPRPISVMQLNIWQEGSVIPNGYDAIVDEIAYHQPDFVTLSEVRNYNDIDFTARLVESLGEQGLSYYSERSDDSGLLSRYPIETFYTIYPLDNDSGSMYKLTTTVDDVPFAVYTAHLDYKDYASFLPRGYDGSTFKKLDTPITDLSVIEQMNLASKRDDAIEAFLADAALERERGAIVILGGDFNEPSFRDWDHTTKDLYDHNGVIFEWSMSRMLEDNGFVDSYRELYPSAVTHPGFTYPSDNTSLGDENIGMLTWAPDADERERIDMIYFAPHPSLKLVDSYIYGPRESIVYSQRVGETSDDKFILPQAIWPTDHKGVVTYFNLQ